MTYWHIQLHPTNEQDNYDTGKIVQETKLIGLGDWSKGEAQRKQFENEMKIGDIVLVRKGARAKALVEVTGEFEDTLSEPTGLAWFQFRRKVEILEMANENMPSFPQPRGTLQKSINKYTQTYNYIDGWYKKILNPNKSDFGFKVRKVEIDNCKMFNNFQISFLDKNNKPLSMVVIAGKNGTGKTTLLEYIGKLRTGINYQFEGELRDSSKDKEKVENIIYIDALTENNKEVEQLILDYIDYFIYDESKDAAVGAENLQNDIDEIFKDFDLNFQFKKIDYKTKKPIFEPYNALSDDIEIKLQELSTGERTLLSKVLSLYLQKPKGKVILIDEPETSLHPSWQNKILKFYENFATINNNQIIIATHSSHIIGSAKPEYIRVLKKVDDKIEVLANIDRSYGLEFDKILTDIMGVENLRTPAVAKDIRKLWELLEDEVYESEEYLNLYNELEELLGSLDKDMVLARLEIARIKSRNAKS